MLQLRSVAPAICSAHSANKRGRGNHQDALHLPDPGQELRRGDRLHGLSKAHVICQHRALAERQVHHPFPLVGKQGELDQIEAQSTRLDLRAYFVPSPLAFTVASIPLQPTLHKA